MLLNNKLIHEELTCIMLRTFPDLKMSNFYFQPSNTISITFSINTSVSKHLKLTELEFNKMLDIEKLNLTGLNDYIYVNNTKNNQINFK